MDTPAKDLGLLYYFKMKPQTEPAARLVYFVKYIFYDKVKTFQFDTRNFPALVQIIESFVFKKRAIHFPRLGTPEHEFESLIAVFLPVKEIDCLVTNLENSLAQ